MMNKEWKITKIPDGALDIHDTEEKIKSKAQEKQKKKEEAIKANAVKELEKIIKTKRKTKTLVKTASIKDVQIALGKKYIIERDKNYKCRRWVISDGKKDWYIRFNDPLFFAVDFIQEHGARKFLKKYEMKSRGQ